MKSYPIHVPLDAYRGSNPRRSQKRDNVNRIAHKIQAHINNILEHKPENCVKVFYSYQIAAEIREDAETVRLIVYGIDCGSNGVTVFKGDYEKAIQNPQ